MTTTSRPIISSDRFISSDHRGYQGRKRKFTAMLNSASRTAVTRPHTLPPRTATPTATVKRPVTR
jgi:hypothetical protein